MTKEEADPAEEMEKEQLVRWKENQEPQEPSRKEVGEGGVSNGASWGQAMDRWLGNAGVTGPRSWWGAGVEASSEWVPERKGEGVETESRQLFQGV